jgi:hypothetical protein
MPRNATYLVSIRGAISQMNLLQGVKNLRFAVVSTRRIFFCFHGNYLDVLSITVKALIVCDNSAEGKNQPPTRDQEFWQLDFLEFGWKDLRGWRTITNTLLSLGIYRRPKIRMPLPRSR